MRQTEVDDQCDKLTVDSRKYCQLSINDDSSVCRAERPFCFCRAKLTIRCDNRHGVEIANILLMSEFQTERKRQNCLIFEDA